MNFRESHILHLGIQTNISVIITSLVIVRSSTSITHIVEEGVKDFTDYNWKV
jgi:hypothetical protein